MWRLAFSKGLYGGILIFFLCSPALAQNTLEGCLKRVQMSGASACIIWEKSGADTPDLAVKTNDQSVENMLTDDPEAIETERRIWEARYEMALRRLHSPYKRPDGMEAFLKEKNAFQKKLDTDCHTPDCYVEKTRRYIFSLKEKYYAFSEG